MTTNGRPLADLRADVVAHLRNQYLGPAGGPEEEIPQRPDRVYLVGTLYPRGRSVAPDEGGVLGDDAADDDLDDSIELANAWNPASAAISFLHDAPIVSCTVEAGRYDRSAGGHGWQRSPLAEHDVRLDPATGPVPIFGGRARLVAVWRRTGEAWLVSVAIENTAHHDDAESPPPTEDCLFQVSMRCGTLGGRVLPYPAVSLLSEDEDEQELRLLYRGRQTYGVGHGCSVTWEDGETPTWVASEMLPASIVPAVSPGDRAADVLRLAHLADEAVPAEQLCDELSQFVRLYGRWIDGKRADADGLPDLHKAPAGRLLVRMNRARERMLEGVELLRRDATALVAFRLATRAMRTQILQTNHVKENPGSRGVPLVERPDPDKSDEPSWYPFQLAFQLLAISSTADAHHADRSTVDLIWFPTGGGKTEAYLALAAFEIIRRRLTRGPRGGGTAVLTRYTLRMLTAQQLQRAAALICALELLRASEPRLAGAQPFSIGLWVGGETTPNDYITANERRAELLRSSQPADDNPFQVNTCPWCGTTLLPDRRSRDAGAYGVRATRASFELFCTHAECPFGAALPVKVVDDQIFDDPPTLLVATVDKFARMPWSKDAGHVLGRDVFFDPPSLVIQDELHLLSGPLGTTVALYESAVLGLIGWDGARPKIVASTATIRSAPEQVRRLYGAEVALFPPSGLDADDSYFAQTDRTAPGRMYIGLMPQAHTQSYATVLTTVALLEAPMLVGETPADLDAYWTLVAYHNSLRELGRTVTIARDDVDTLLAARADRRGERARRLRTDGVIELTSNVGPGVLVRRLAQLSHPYDAPDSVDFVATTNMLSVGIDISRLGLMLMNGQPKTTSEYIQATSRVGRATVPGLVVVLLRAGKPRDRSHYESFRAYHEAIYRHVEPTSVTPWSLASRERSLHAALVMLVRHGAGLRVNEDAANFITADPRVKKAVDILHAAVLAAEPDAVHHADDQVRKLTAEWQRRATDAAARGQKLRYVSTDRDHAALLRNYGEVRDGWDTMNSMRSVDRSVRVIAIGEQR